MKIEIRKWGNSLAIRIPDAFAKELSLGEGTVADLRLEGGRLVLEPVLQVPKYSLQDLVAGITDENRHVEIDWGQPVGKEFW